MLNPSEYCPNCGGTRKASISIGTLTQTQPDGSEAVEIMFHLHCSSCNTFLRSIPCIDDGESSEKLEAPLYFGVID